MGLELRQQVKLGQMLVMTPQLQQAIRLLQLSRLDLLERVQQELEENPFLEESAAASPAQDQHLLSEQDARSAHVSERDASQAYDSEASRNADWEEYLGDFASSPRDYRPRDLPEDEGLSVEARYAEKPTLEGHLRWQLHLSDLSPEDVAIGECIIGNLASSGYLQASVDEIAAITGKEASRVAAVLARVQVFDPVGVAARDVKECLRIQLKDRGLADDPVLSDLLEHLDDLEARRYKPIMRRHGLGPDELREYLDVIQSLDPKPGSSFGGSDPIFVSPDIYVRKVGGEFVILLNDDGLPHLTISDLCEAGLKGKDAEYCNEKKKAASWLIRSIEQRNRTLYKVMESIVRRQRSFFEIGVRGLRPLILKDIAEDISMHESTVSRITTNKFVSTSFGIFELKFFFNSAVSLSNGSQIGSESVKDCIRQLIAEEDPKNPLSDDTIVHELHNRLGIEIARRTVAKYRTALDIPSSSRRRRTL